MKEVIEKKINNLNQMLEKYKKLNIETKGKFNYREIDIVNEIQLLEEILREETGVAEWEECYREDREEAE